MASSITIELVDDPPLHLLGTFIGPPNRPYKGGTYRVDIGIPQTYPFSSPNFDKTLSSKRFLCVWRHLPRYSQDAWSPVLTLKSTIVSLQGLLCSPEPTDPQGAEVAKH